MTCHDHIDALIEIARDSTGACLAEARDDAGERRRTCPAEARDDAGERGRSEAARAALAHAGTCEACAARLDRERLLTASLREIAAATPAPDGRALEQRLLHAFAECHESAPREKQRPPVGVSKRSWWVLASAAALLLSASVAWYVLATRQGTAPPSAAARVADPPSPAPLAANVAPPIPSAKLFAVAAPPHRRPRHPDPVDEARLFSDFIALPEASALPDFESGRILRIEVPVSMLPAYGLHMVSQAAPAAVEADLLVGQDGLPRAIRLAFPVSNQE